MKKDRGPYLDMLTGKVYWDKPDNHKPGQFIAVGHLQMQSPDATIDTEKRSWNLVVLSVPNRSVYTSGSYLIPIPDEFWEEVVVNQTIKVLTK